MRPHVLDCLQRLLPERVPSLDDALDPIANLGLDSLDGINFIVILGKILHHDFPPEFNPFFDSAGRSRNIGRIVESIQRKMPSGTRETAAPSVQP